MGRPPIVPGQSKDVLFGVRISAEEAKEIERGIAESGMSKPDWGRTALLGATARGRIILRLRCPNCGNEVRKLPRQLKSGGATICPKCGNSFIDKAVLKEAESLAKFLEFGGA